MSPGVSLNGPPNEKGNRCGQSDNESVLKDVCVPAVLTEGGIFHE